MKDTPQLVRMTRCHKSRIAIGPNRKLSTLVDWFLFRGRRKSTQPGRRGAYSGLFKFPSAPPTSCTDARSGEAAHSASCVPPSRQRFYGWTGRVRACVCVCLRIEGTPQMTRMNGGYPSGFPTNLKRVPKQHNDMSSAQGKRLKRHLNLAKASQSSINEKKPHLFTREFSIHLDACEQATMVEEAFY